MRYIFGKLPPTAEQTKICEKYQSAVVPCYENEIIALAVESIGKQPTYGTRIRPKSGEKVAWFFYSGENTQETDFFKPVHIHHVKELMPELEKYLCLDFGYKIIIDDRGYEDVWRESEMIFS